MLNQITCPRCQTPFTADIHQVIDVGQDPQLKYDLLNGQLNLFTCPNCGMSGQMATPLLYHDPEHELFMVHVPMELNLPHEEQQKLIGRLVQEAMNQIPAEQRRGYMLQPQEIISYQTFLEKILATEGITPEMIARQRKQSELLQQLAQADKDVRDQLLEEHSDQIDETFFAMLHSLIDVAQRQGDDNQLLRLTNLQAKLYTETEVGRELEKRQSALRAFQKEVRAEEALTPEILLKHVLKNKEDEGTVDALIAMGQAAFNYEFFSLLTEEIEAHAKKHEKEEAKELTQLRQRLLDVQTTLQEQSRAILDEAMDTLQLLMDAEDMAEAIRQNAARIDDTFMSVLAALRTQAEQAGQRDQAEALRRVYELIIQEAENQVPPQIRLLNKLMRAESEAEQRRVLEENQNLMTPELVQMLEMLGREMASQGETKEMTDEIAKLKAMVEARV
jgi:hypothetical protein